MEEIPSRKRLSALYRYDKGELILREGDLSQFVYILNRGTLAIFKGDAKINEISGKGLIFGEMSSILSRPRSSSVYAETECEVTVIRGGVHGIIKRFPHVAEKIMAQLAERIREMNEKYCRMKEKYSELYDKILLLEIDLKSAKENNTQKREIPLKILDHAPEKDVDEIDYVDDGFALGIPSKKSVSERKKEPESQRKQGEETSKQ